MNGIRRLWWRSAALALVGGTTAAGGWFGFAHADPLPIPQQKSAPSTKADPVVPWVRSTSTPLSESPVEKVLPPTSKFPAMPIPAAPAVPPTISPVIPASAKMVVPVVPTPTMPVQVQPPSPLPTTPPTVPAVPEFKPVAVPAVPGNIDPLPTPTPVVPMAPKVDELPKPVITPPLNVTPPALPLKSADPAKPMLPLPTDFNLRPMNGGNNVNPDAPVTPIVPVPTPTTVPALPMPSTNEPMLALPTGTGTAAPQVPTITGSRTKPSETPIAPTEKYVFPVPVPTTTEPGSFAVPTYTQPPTPGVSPMLNNPTVLSALTGIALAFGPSATADEPTKPDPVEIARKLDLTIKKLDDAEKEIKRLKTLLDGRYDEKGFLLPSDPGAVSEIKALKDKVNALQTQINDMKTNSTSLRPNLPTALGKGTVKVVNEYPVPVSIIINDKNYRVEPSTTLNVDIPVGDFSYQLLQSGAAATKSTIKDKEVVTLRVK